MEGGPHHSPEEEKMVVTGKHRKEGEVRVGEVHCGGWRGTRAEGKEANVAFLTGVLGTR